MKLRLANISLRTSGSFNRVKRLKDVAVNGLTISWESDVTCKVTSDAWDGAIEATGSLDISGFNIIKPVFTVTLTPIKKSLRGSSIKVTYPDVGVGYYKVGSTLIVGYVSPKSGIGIWSVNETFKVK